MAQLCVCIASNDLVILGFFEGTTCVVLKFPGLGSVICQMGENQGSSEGGNCIHTRNMLTCNPYGPGSLISSEAIMYSSWSIGVEQLVDVTVSGEQEPSGIFPLCHRSNFATYRNLVRLECIQNLVLSGKDFFGEEKLGQLLHWDIRLGSLLCQKF